MLKVSIISPESMVFEGDVPSVVAPAHDGEVGILTGHAAMVTVLGTGKLRLGNGKAFAIEGGFLQVADNEVRVVTEQAATA